MGRDSLQRQQKEKLPSRPLSTQLPHFTWTEVKEEGICLFVLLAWHGHKMKKHKENPAPPQRGGHQVEQFYQVNTLRRLLMNKSRHWQSNGQWIHYWSVCAFHLQDPQIITAALILCWLASLCSVALRLGGTRQGWGPSVVKEHSHVAAPTTSAVAACCIKWNVCDSNVRTKDSVRQQRCKL